MTYAPRTPFTLLVLLFLCACEQSAERAESGDIVHEGEVDVFSMQVGDCFDDQKAMLSDDSEIDSVPGVPCNEAHDNEAFYKFDSVLTEWPGDEALEDIGKQECLKHFEGYVGKSYDDSSLDIFSIKPTEYGWRKLDDREVVCVAYDMEFSKLTRSVKNSEL